MIKAVLFDLDDTLFDHEHCARTALDSVRSAHPCFAPITRETLDELHGRILEELHPEVLSGRMALDAARTERFKRLFAAAGVDADQTLAEQVAATYRRWYVDSRRAIAGAAELLEAVRQRARVGIVSNNLLEEQQDKLRCCRLDQYIDVLVVSEEAGVSKPHALIFDMALERLGCRSDEAVMIGDSWAADIVGATAAGIRAIWFDRGARASTSSIRDTGRGEMPVAVITSLEPTPELLKTIFED